MPPPDFDVCIGATVGVDVMVTTLPELMIVVTTGVGVHEVELLVVEVERVVDDAEVSDVCDGRQLAAIQPCARITLF